MTAGGAIYMSVLSSLEMSGVSFDGCASTVGGGLAILQGAEPISFMQTPFAITRCTWTRNRAARDGGSVYLNLVTAPVNFVGCDWSESSARGTGGALYAMTAVVRITITVSDSAVNASSADRGGAIFTSFVQLELYTTTISNTQGQTQTPLRLPVMRVRSLVGHTGPALQSMGATPPDFLLLFSTPFCCARLCSLVDSL